MAVHQASVGAAQTADTFHYWLGHLQTTLWDVGDVTNRLLSWLILAAIALIAIAVYWSRYSSEHMRITPEAADEIEKAKRR
jgi:hypothetical protein